jgi:hypothetical protein
MPYKDPIRQRAYDREWRRKRRAEWVEANGPCAHCGGEDQLEVDHVNRADKTMEPASIWGRRLEEREAELAKCQVLCHECHANKTASEREPAQEHGTWYTWQEKKCRCEQCRFFFNNYRRDWRRRKQSGVVQR